MYSTRPYQVYSFRCWFPNNSVQFFFLKMLSQIHFRQNLLPSSLFFWVHSYISSGGFVMLLFSTHHLVCQRSCSFRAYPFNRSVVSSLQVLFIVLSLASLFNRTTVWNPSYPLCHSFNSSGGSVLLISSSILSSCQVHVQFLPFTVGVLSKLYHS